MRLVYSAPERPRLPPLTFQGEDAQQWIDEVAGHFLRNHIHRDQRRQARYLALAVDNDRAALVVAERFLLVVAERRKKAATLREELAA